MEKWKTWNKQGLIPGPIETEEEFETRVAYCLELKNTLAKSTELDISFKIEDEKTKHLLQEAFPLTEKLYGIAPDWVPLFFSNKKLAPWHGGCTWMFQLTENSPTACFLQLRSHFYYAQTFLKIYDRTELIAHELAHVGRMTYQEPKFEEFFAYQSASSSCRSSWRKVFGPMIEHPRESLLFVLFLTLMIGVDGASLFFSIETLSLGLWIKGFFFTWIACGFIRLFFRHKTYSQALFSLQKLYGEERGRHLLYRLSDSEIKQFSCFSSEQIKNFIDNASKKTFRWLFLKTVYG